jgi:hypothetical protein
LICRKNPAVGKRIRETPESAGTKSNRESEVAVVPKKLGKAEWRKGPLLPSSVRRRERLPDCPREGRLNPGEKHAGANRLRA